MEERLPRVRRRADQRGREEGRRDTAPVRAEARPARYLGTADIARGSRARRCQLRCGSVSPPARAAPARGARPSRRTPLRRRRYSINYTNTFGDHDVTGLFLYEHSDRRFNKFHVSGIDLDILGLEEFDLMNKKT